MDAIAADLALQAVLGRGDFIGGIDNEALDFSQLEAFINSDSSTGSSYFNDSLSTGPPNAAGKLLNVIVENKRQPGHALPESPPDSGSEHPYSPSESCEPQINSQEMIYTTLGQSPHLYKQEPSLLNPLLTDNIILGNSIVVQGQRHPSIINSDGSLAENRILVQTQNAEDARLLQNVNGRILIQSPKSNGSLTHIDGRILQDGLTDGRHMIISASEAADGEQERGILIQPGPTSQGSSVYSDRSLLIEPSEPLRPEIDTLAHPYNPNLDISHTSMDGPIIDSNIDVIYTNLQSAPKKRKLSQDTPLVKSEPELCPPGQLSPPSQLSSSLDDDYAGSESGTCLSDSQYQCIKFQPFQQNLWHVLCDQNLAELPVPHYRVDADKGFNFSNADDAFVCQKKNHFQITCHVQLVGDAQFVKTSEGLQKINSFHLHFYGVKYDCPTQTIRVEQSQSDRSKKPFHPVLVELVSTQVTKVTVGRLHFSETTSNNMRKKGKPNPEQRYFQLVVGLHAHTSHGNFPVASHASQRIIVRASNPGQFESDVELCWQKGQTQESIFHAGKVGINTDRPDESLVIHGNLKITGHIIQPSDLRAKKNIVECDTAEQLRNVQRLRVVRYEYAPSFAQQLNLNSELSDTGVIAQEVAQILPEAVSPTGDITLNNGRTINNFLVVNKERIFMENVGAVKELCKVTDNLETRIGQLERINRRLNKLKRDDSLKSTSTVNSSKLSQKCHKHHPCHNEQELCSNKFIQIVIVILVLIMAFCLAAITILYLMETSRHNQLTQANIDMQKEFHMKRLVKTTKIRPWHPQNVHQGAYKEKENEINNIRSSQENTIPSTRLPMVIGKPAYCQGMDGDVELSSLCRVYCCVPTMDSSEVETTLYDKSQKPNLNLTKSPALINMDKNKVSKPFHSNNIDKPRQKRDSDGFWDENNYDNLESPEHIFTIIIQGRNFNLTLTKEYCQDCSSNTYNYSYTLPISKYMSDDYILLTFKSNHQNIKELEQCYNEHKNQECPYITQNYWDENKSHGIHKGSENIGNKASGNTFDVDMSSFQNKMLTYRASLLQNQNVCRLSSSKIGIEYVEYNLNFYRDCEE